jgi:hypothetical protein
MIKTRIGLYAVDTTVVRPILITVAKDINNMLDMNKETYTEYDVNDDSDIKRIIERNGSATGSTDPYYDFITVNSEEQGEEGLELSLIPMNPDHKPIFLDEDIKASMKPIYSSKKLVLKYRYYNMSKSRISTLCNKIRLLTSSDDMHRLHTLEYHYLMPTFTLLLMQEFNNLKNLRLEDDFKLDLDQYTGGHMDDRADLANTIDGIEFKSDLIIREQQLEVNGYIKSDLHSIEPQQDEKNNAWYLEFDYEILYEKPVSLFLTYPILIYNSLIDKKFRKFLENKPTSSEAYRSHRSSSLHDLTKRDTSFNIPDNKTYLTIPSFDDEKLPEPPSFISRMFSVMLLVSEEDPYDVINIKTLPRLENKRDSKRIAFKEPLLNFIISDREFVTTLHGSLVLIELFKNNKIDFENKLVLDEEGNIRTEKPMDLKYTYRIMFSIVNDLDMLRPDSKVRVKEYINSEIDRLKDIQKEYGFQEDIYRDGNRISNPTGVEQYDYENLIEIYLGLLDITDEQTDQMLSDGISANEILFKIKEPKWSFYKTKQVTAVIAAGLNQV